MAKPRIECELAKYVITMWSKHAVIAPVGIVAQEGICHRRTVRSQYGIWAEQGVIKYPWGRSYGPAPGHRFEKLCLLAYGDVVETDHEGAKLRAKVDIADDGVTVLKLYVGGVEYTATWMDRIVSVSGSVAGDQLEALDVAISEFLDHHIAKLRPDPIR